MRSRKNTKQKENKGNREIFSIIEGIYSRARLLGKKRGVRKCERSVRRF